jgi:hypothetical protein
VITDVGTHDASLVEALRAMPETIRADALV